jgi:AraC family ethanolamine operon transcriptional activator
MPAFDDFDAWGDTVNGASLRMACDAVQVRRWTLDFFDLGAVALQAAFEGGGNICYGANTHAGTMLFVPLSHASAHVVNGEPLDEHSLLVIPRGGDFRIRVRRCAHSWCSVALPFDTPRSLAWIAREPESVARLKRVARAIAASLGGRPGDGARLAAGRDLQTLAAACLALPQELQGRSGRPRLDRVAIMRGAMHLIEASPVVPTALELSRGLGVTGRTLQRTFQESFGLPPKRYLLLRQLHRVRRSLKGPAADDTTVADVLARHGIWEFGRFATRYRRQFGELPSETLARNHR